MTDQDIFTFIERLAKDGQQDLSDQCAVAHHRFMREDRQRATETKAGPAWARPGYIFEDWAAVQAAQAEGLAITSEAALRERVLSIAPADQPFTASDLKEALYAKARTEPEQYRLSDGDWSLVYRNTEEPVFVYVMAIGMTCHSLDQEGVFVRGEGKNCRTYRLASGVEEQVVQLMTEPLPEGRHLEHLLAV